MKKTLVFTDAHAVGKDEYNALLDAAIKDNIENIMFLGDIDYQEGHFQFRRFMEFVEKAGIDMGPPIMGNHTQDWEDYARFEEDVCVAMPAGHGPDIDRKLRSGKSKDRFLGFMKYFKDEHRLEDLLFTHALPMGRVLSGPHGKNKSTKGKQDHRKKYRHLWHYSFNTYDAASGQPGPRQGTGHETFDPQVLAWNFDMMEKQGLNFMLKGHEHYNKIWTREDCSGFRPIRGGNMIAPGTKIQARPRSIVQVADFQKGNYAVIEKQDGKLVVDYRKI